MSQTMTQGNMTAIVTIPDRFEANIQQKRYPEVSVDINGANMLTGNYAATGIQTSLTVINAGIEIETLKKKAPLRRLPWNNLKHSRSTSRDFSTRPTIT